jgi:hypothetical protein
MSFFAPESWLASKYIEKKIVGQPGLTYVPSRKEKVHSTTLKYRCYLSLDPQPQNQLLRIPEEFNPPPPSGLMGCFGLHGDISPPPTWIRRHINRKDINY